MLIFSQEFTRKETKLTFAKNIQFCKMGKKRLISHKISHIAKTHIFARDFLYGYYYVVICAIYIGQCGGYNIVSLGIVFKRLIISISEAVQRLSQWWDGGFNTDFHGFRRIFTDLGGFPHYVLCWLI